MGCVPSKKDINDLHPNIFQVSNVDDLGNRISSGQLEINETELVLYQEGKPTVRWPLKTLRRYGYENQVFSFETGRRCPTGEGIYAFSCRRAEKLFNFVQSHIQIRNDDTLSREATVTRTADYLEPRPPRLSVNNGPSSRLSSVGSSNASPSPPPNNDFPPPYSNYYVNDPIFRVEEEVAGESLPPLSPAAISGEMEEAASPVYMNVGTGTAVVVEEDDSKHCYMNLVAGVGPIVAQRQLSLPPPPPPPPPPPVPPERTVNYIVLDLDSTGSPPAAPPSPATRQPPTEGYATIDFNKTVALSHSVNPNCIDNEGSRKTRHNSATPRQSASLSD